METEWTAYYSKRGELHSALAALESVGEQLQDYWPLVERTRRRSTRSLGNTRDAPLSDGDQDEDATGERCRDSRSFVMSWIGLGRGLDNRLRGILAMVLSRLYTMRYTRRKTRRKVGNETRTRL